MMGLKDRDKMSFPLETVDSVVALVIDQLDAREEPNLTLLSVVLGAVEQSVTNNNGKDSNNRNEAVIFHSAKTKTSRSIPSLGLETVEAMYEQFESMIRGSVDMSQYHKTYSTLDCLKKVSDVVWEACPSTVHKDRIHLQTLYTLLTDNKVDCFGMAMSVVAGCQLLGLKDVHLAITEDHTWAVFGENGRQSAEITWHGRGMTEERRGLPVDEAITKKNWLYQNPIVCTSRQMEVVAMVVAINPCINVTADSAQMSQIQHELLWALYDRGLLNKHPIALDVLADMEEMSPTSGRPSSLDLYSLAVDNSIKYFSNLFIYPYTYIGNYHYRHRHYREAIKHWASAAFVVSRYNYNREDEVLYKEFFEIATSIIPNIMKMSSSEVFVTSNAFRSSLSSSSSTANISTTLLNDVETYANLLRLYDGVCVWEEGSSMPVLHIVWANHICFVLSKFEARIRSKVELVDGNEERNEAQGSAARSTNKKNGRARSESTAEVKRSLSEVDTPRSPDLESPESPVEASQGSMSQTVKVIPLNNQDEEEAAAPVTKLDVTPVTRHTRLSEEKVKVVLYSEKMTGIRDLLLSDKLNPSAIKLQLTAQLQVQVKPSVSAGGNGGNSSSDSSTPAANSNSRKRQKRE